MTTPMTDAEWLEQRLYGAGDAEMMFRDLDAAIEDAVANLCLRLEDGPIEFVIEEMSVLPRGDAYEVRMPTGAEIVEDIVERFAEDCVFEDLADELWEAARDDDVVAAFDAAIALLRSKQRFPIANKLIARHVVTVTAVDVDEPGRATWTVGRIQP